MAAKSDASLKIPVPEVVHVELTALPPLVPERVYVLPWQMTASAPALAVAARLMVNIIASKAAGQGPGGSLVVRVNVTLPVAMSAAEGV